MTKMLSVKDIQIILGVGKDWVYERVKKGEIPSYKMGRYIRFNEEEVKSKLSDFKSQIKSTQDEDGSDEQDT